MHADLVQASLARSGGWYIGLLVREVNVCCSLPGSPGSPTSAPAVLRKPRTTGTAGGRQPMKATEEYGLHSLEASRVPRGRSLAATPRTGLTRSNSLPRNYRPRSYSPVVPPSGSHSTGEIRFYNQYDPYYEFTNFYHAPIDVDGKKWPTTEHYFQAQKFIGTPYMEKIRTLSTPREAFQFSRSPTVHRWQRSDWEEVKEDIMLKALHCKFDQHTNLRRILLETREKKLIEHTSNDSYWGDGGDGSGRNRLGELLMKVRRELREKHGSPPPSYQYSSFHFPEEKGGSPASGGSYGLRSSRQRSASVSNLTDIAHEYPTRRSVSPQPTRSFTSKNLAVSNPGHTSLQPKHGTALDPRSTSRMPSLRPPVSGPSRVTRSGIKDRPTHGSSLVETEQKSSLRPRPLPPTPTSQATSNSPRTGHSSGRNTSYNPITHKAWY